MESMKDQEEQKDRKNQKDLLAELETIENELTGYVKSDQRNWVHIYQSISRVESEKLYKARGLSSFTAWVNSRAESMGVHVSLLWARLKAGRVYAEYAARAKARGKEAVPIDRLSNVSPDSLSLCARVAGKNADVMDRLVEKTVAGELSREDLRAAAQAKKAAGSAPAKSRYTAVTAEDRQTGLSTRLQLPISLWPFVHTVNGWVRRTIIRMSTANIMRLLSLQSIPGLPATIGASTSWLPKLLRPFGAAPLSCAGSRSRYPCTTCWTTKKWPNTSRSAITFI